MAELFEAFVIVLVSCMYLGTFCMFVWSILDDNARHAISYGVVLFVMTVFGVAGVISRPHRASNEFCRQDTVGKTTYTTCITPVSPALMPVTPTAER